MTRTTRTDSNEQETYDGVTIVVSLNTCAPNDFANVIIIDTKQQGLDSRHTAGFKREHL